MSQLRRRNSDPDLELWPTLTFWYGLSFIELTVMPRWAVEMYAEELPTLIAEVQQMNLTAASFPHMKKQHQFDISNKIKKRLRKRRAPEPTTAAAPSVPELAAAGIGFVEVDSDA